MAENPKANPVHFPTDRRIRIRMRTAFMIFFVLVVLVLRLSGMLSRYSFQPLTLTLTYRERERSPPYGVAAWARGLYGSRGEGGCL